MTRKPSGGVGSNQYQTRPPSSPVSPSGSTLRPVFYGPDVMQEDRLQEVPAGECRCASTGHRLLTAAAASSEGAYNGTVRVSRPVRRDMHRSGLLNVQESETAGWERGMWLAQLTPAGRFHLAAVNGDPTAHVNGCGGHINVNGDCEGCGAQIAMTIGEARRRLEALPSSPERDEHGGEVWASAFSCETHGVCRASMVTTKKTCARCGAGLIRHGITVLDR